MNILDWRWWLGLRPKFKNSYHNYSIAVVVPAYNEEENIKATLDSLMGQTVIKKCKSYRIIVVDDFSSDRTNEFARSKGAEVIRPAFNQGTKAAAQNYALPMINDDLIVTVDADTKLDPKAIENTLYFFNDPKTASVCGMVIPQKIKTIWEKGRFIEYLFGITIFKGAQNNVGAILVSSGCFSVFRTKLLKTIGGFDAKTMAEDMYATWKFQLLGYHIYFAPDAYCYPLDPPNMKIYLNQLDRWYRSFFQNIKAHSLKRNKKLAIFIYSYLIDGIFSPIMIALLLIFLAGKLPLSLLILLVLSELIVIFLVCLPMGIKLKMFSKVLVSIPCYYFVRPFNVYIFLRSFWKEWIIKEPLAVWHKGH